MKTAITSTVVAGMLLGAFAAAEAQTTQPAAEPAAPVTVELDGLSVSLPAGFEKFAKDEQTVESESGPIRSVTYVSKSAAGDAIIVSFSEFSGPLLNPNQMMTSGKDSLLKGANAKSESEEPKELDGQPGLHLLFSADQPRPLFGRGQYGVQDDRMYQLIYLAGSPDRRLSPEAELFFGSIDLEEQADAEAPASETPAAKAPPEAAAPSQ